MLDLSGVGSGSKGLWYLGTIERNVRQWYTKWARESPFFY